MTAVRNAASPGISPLWPNTAVPFLEIGTATKSSGAGGSGVVVSQTVTRSLSMIGGAPSARADKFKVRATRTAIGPDDVFMSGPPAFSRYTNGRQDDTRHVKR